jgi:hypothetical protein
MKKLWMTSAGLVLATTVWLASSTGSTGATLADYSRATNVDPTEVAIHCVNGACVIPLVVPWTFQLGSVGTPYDAVVTASFTYKTSKGLKVAASPDLLDGTTPIVLTDVDRPLGPAARTRSTSLMWVIPALDANTTYGLNLSVQPIGTPPPTYDISVSDVTLVVEASQPS